MSKLVQQKALEQARIKPNTDINEFSQKQKRKRNAEIDIEPNDNKIIDKIQVKSKNPKVKSNSSIKGTSNDSSDVIYLGHLPHGFYEIQLKKFFTQFGIVRKVKLFRSPKTGGSKGFAFLQFESNETAQVVAEAMNGYYLHDRQLVSHIIPKSKHHDGMWKMKKPSVEMINDNDHLTNDAINNENTTDKNDITKKNEKLLKRLTEKQKQLNDLGFDFQIPNLSN